MRFVYLCSAFYLYFSICLISSCFAQAEAEYLNSHKQDISNNISESDILDADFFNHSVFLLGEAHGDKSHRNWISAF